MSDGAVTGMFDANAQSSIDASIAQANAAEASGNAAARIEHATAALKAMTAAMRPEPSATPSNSIEAGQRLAHLQKDATFRAQYLSGNVEARREHDRLVEMVASGNETELAIAGVVPPASVDENAGSVAGPEEMVASAKHLRDAGLTDSNIAEIFDGRLLADNGAALDAAEVGRRVAEAERWMARVMRDPTFRHNFLNGDREAADMMLRASATIAAGRK